MKYIHCRICGRVITRASLSFRTRMAKVRKHYKKHHYSSFREGVRRGARKRRYGR